MRVLRWKDDFNIELLGGGSYTSDGAPTAYGDHMDKSLEVACRDLVKCDVCIDGSVVQKLLLEVLRRSNHAKLQISEGEIKTSGKVWANRFFKRHKYLVHMFNLKDSSGNGASLAIVEGSQTDQTNNFAIDNLTAHLHQAATAEI